MQTLVRFAVFTILLAAATGIGHAAEPAAPDSPEAVLAVFTCTPAGAAEFVQRVHVRCNPAAPGGIAYFATATSDPDRSARALAIFSAALLAGRTVAIFYDPADLSGSAIGCGNADCRVFVGAEM